MAPFRPEDDLEPNDEPHIDDADLPRGAIPDAPGDSFHLLERYKKGDQEALAELLERYRVELHRYARRVLGKRGRGVQDSEDVVQHVIAHAIPRLPHLEYRGAGSILRYLKKAALRRVMNIARKPASMRRVEDPVREEDLLDLVPDREGSVSVNLREAELVAILDETFIRLDPEEQELIAGRRFQDRSFDDLAEDLDLPSAVAAEKAYGRAKSKWQTLLVPRLKAWFGSG